MSADPSLVVNRTLMQNYKPETPVSGVGALVLVQDPQGGPVAFSVGNTGAVMCLSPDPGEPGGWASTATGLTAGVRGRAAIGAGIDNTLTNIAVLTPSGNTVAYVVRDANGAWGRPQKLSSTLPSPILAVKARYINEELVVVLFTSCGIVPGDAPYSVYWGVWQGAATNLTAFTKLAFPVDSLLVEPAARGVYVFLTPTLYTRTTRTWADQVYNDVHTGADTDFGVWRAAAPAGFYLVGDGAIAHQDTEPGPILTVASVEDPTGPPLLVPPTGYTEIWNDTGSGGLHDGSLWLPSAAGYVALGYVADKGNDGNQPTIPALRLVRADQVLPGVSYVPSGAVGETGESGNKNLIWKTDPDDSGAQPVAVDRITVPSRSAGLAAGTFGAHGDWNQPSYPTYCLDPRAAGTTVVLFASDSFGAMRVIPDASPARVVAASYAIDVDGNPHFLLALEDGTLWHANSSAWAQIDSAANGSYTAVAATMDPGGENISGFALRGGALVHVAEEPFTNDTWLPTTLLDAGVPYGAVAVGLLDPNTPFALAVTAQGGLTLAFAGGETQDWSVGPVELASSGAIVEGYTFTTDIQLLDGSGLPIAGSPLQISLDSGGEAVLTVNGHTALVDGYAGFTVATDVTGRVTITGDAPNLVAPMIEVHSSLFTSGESVSIQPNADIQATLSTADGASLIANLGTDPDEADDAAQTLNQLMTLVGPAPTTSATRYLSRTLDARGLRYHAPGNRVPLGVIDPSTHSQQCWHADLSGEKLRYTALSTEDAAARRVALLARDDRSDDLPGWLGSLGDLVAQARANLVSGLKFLWDGVTMAVDFVVDGITYVFDAVLSLTQQVFDLATLVFDKIKAGFDSLVKWVGFLFSWQDILATKDALKHFLMQILGLPAVVVPALQARLAGALAAASDTISDGFDSLIASASGQGQSFDQVATSGGPAPAATQAAAGRDIVGDYCVRNSGTIEAPTGVTARLALRMAMPASDPDSVGSAWNQISAAGTALVGDTDALKRTLGDSPDADGLVNSAIVTVLTAIKGLVLAAIDGVGAAIGATLDAVAALVQELLALLQEPWEIPFLSQLYRTVISPGNDLTVLDLVSLLIAVPSTIIYKVLHGAAPIPDPATLATFEAGCTTDALAGVMGLRSTPTAAAGVPMWRRLLAGFGGVAACVTSIAYGGFNATLDLVPLGTPTPKAAGIWAVVMEWLFWGFNLSWVLDPTNNGTVFPAADVTAVGNTLSVLYLINPITRTAMFFAGDDGLAAARAGLVFEVLLAAGGAASLVWLFSAARRTGESVDPLTVATNLSINLPGTFRIVRITNHPAALTVSGAVDFLGGALCGVLMLVGAENRAANALAE